MSDELRPRGTFKEVRGISEKTCRRFDYSVCRATGEAQHIATFYDLAGNPVAQHVRKKGKEFPWLGDKKSAVLFGQQAMRGDASKLIITEGEIDAMSVWEVISQSKNRWAVVSIKSGAKGAKKDLADQLEWIEGAGEVILMFDMDEPGQEAAQECARLFRSGKCKIARLPLKDANDMLKADRGHEIIDAIFEAKEYRPEGIKRVADVREEVLTDPVRGLPYWHEGLTKGTLGRRFGELVALGAGTGVGKTDFLTQQIVYDLTQLKEKVGIVFLEQQPAETVRRLAGKFAGKMFHIPAEELDDPWSFEDLEQAVDEIASAGSLYMYDHFGSADYEKIEDYIRYLYHSQEVRIFYIDHLTALAAQSDNERQELESIMARLGGLVKELDVWIALVSHLATPEGKPHEEGGRVMIRHFKGSRSIGFWCHFMFGLERNQQAEDEVERTTTTLRVLKDRVTGRSTGKTFAMGFDQTAGRLIEKNAASLDDNPFMDETGDDEVDVDEVVF